jgi:hypothetical protein
MCWNDKHTLDHLAVDVSATRHMYEGHGLHDWRVAMVKWAAQQARRMRNQSFRERGLRNLTMATLVQALTTDH